METQVIRHLSLFVSLWESTEKKILTSQKINFSEFPMKGTSSPLAIRYGTYRFTIQGRPSGIKCPK